MRSERITVQNIRARITCEADAYYYLEQLRWGDRPVCAHCGSDRVNLLKPANGESRKTRTGSNSQRRVWKCYGCRKQFSVITETVMHGTKVSLEIWVFILFEMCANKNGLATREIEWKYGLTPKTAWFITQRIREAMKREPLAGMLLGRVVADETYIGGKPKNRHQQGRPTRLPGRATGRRPAALDNKVTVLLLVEKETGEVQSRVIPNTTGATLRKAISEQVDMANTVLHTDLLPAYKQFGADVIAHEYVDHSSHEYVRGNVSTNMAEGFFSQFKRSIDGTHHHVSRKHLPRYLAEFDYRYSTRKMPGTARTRMLMGQVGGRRLSYKPLKNGE